MLVINFIDEKVSNLMQILLDPIISKLVNIQQNL